MLEELCDDVDNNITTLRDGLLTLIYKLEVAGGALSLTGMEPSAMANIVDTFLDTSGSTMEGNHNSEGSFRGEPDIYSWIHIILVLLKKYFIPLGMPHNLPKYKDDPGTYSLYHANYMLDTASNVLKRMLSKH